MLFVETNNFRQQETLSQQFVRQGNLFAIPFSKSKQIAVVLKNILFQVFQLEGSQKKPSQNNSQRYGLQLAMKITNFISNLLKLKFSLSAIREIFQTIKAQNSRLSMYQQYFNQMNEYFTEFNEYQCSFSRNKNFIPDKESQQQNQLLRKDSSKNIHLDLDGFQFQNQKTQKQILKTPTKHRISLSSGVIDSQESLIGHSLQSQIFKSPRFTITRLQQLNQSNLNNNDNNDNSFQEQNYTSNLKDEILTNNSVKSSNYCSPFKIESFKNLLQNDNSNTEQLIQKKKDLDKSKYIQDLQGLVNPIPSFLHDEQNLRQMIAKQKKQDIRKSKIIRQQITKIETQSQVSTNTNDKVYYSSYRSIKLNNKLRRSSKKSIPKKDIEQLDNQVQSESKLVKQKIKFFENQLIQNRNQQFFNFLQKQMGDNTKKSKASDTNKEKVKIYSFFKSKKG